MAIQKITNALIYALAADTKPTSYATNTICYVVDTGDMYRWNGSSWALINPGPSTTATLTNKTIDTASNTITGIADANITAHTTTKISTNDKALLPFDTLTGRQTNNGRKWGLNQCGHGGTAIWDGILGAASTVGTGSVAIVGMTSGQLVAADGRFVRYTTNTSTPAANEKGGWRVSTALICRAWNPTFFARFRLNQTADTRMWFGITSDLVSDPTGDDALNAKSGVLFGIGVVNNTVGTGSTVGWQVMHNDGSGATVNETVGPAADTSVHTIEIVAVDSTPKFKYSFDGGSFVDITPDIPATATPLTFIAIIQTSAAATKNVDFFDIHVTSDK